LQALVERLELSEQRLREAADDLRNYRLLVEQNVGKVAP